MATITKQQVLESKDLGSETVDVAEWGGSVIIRGLTGTERDAFEAETVKMNGEETEMNLANIRAKLLARTIVDDAGARLFTDAEAEALGQKSGAVISRLFTIAQRLSGLSPKDVKELAKNLPVAQSGASTSV